VKLDCQSCNINLTGLTTRDSMWGYQQAKIYTC